MNILLLIITTLLTDTAYTEAYLSGTFGQATMTLNGTQQGGFAVGAESIYDIDSVHRVFGEASYTWSDSKHNDWVENADWTLLYPYLTCDTAGGGLRTERYWFRGGYRMFKKQVLWHIALQFRAEQSYRDIDPRPNNKVADIRLDGSVGYAGKDYACGLTLNAGRYKQSNTMKFYSELGAATIYHLVAPAADYVRFRGAYYDTHYHGYTLGAGLYLQPRTTGFLAGADYTYFTVSEELHDNTYIPIAVLQTHTVDLSFGYNGALWRVVADGGLNLRRGKQVLYGDAANNYFYELMREQNYIENGWYIGAKGDYSVDLPVGRLSAMADIQYQQQYISALTAVTPQYSTLGDLLTSDKIQCAAALTYAFPIKGRFHWFFRPQAAYKAYLTAETYVWSVTLQTGVRF